MPVVGKISQFGSFRKKILPDINRIVLNFFSPFLGGVYMEVSQPFCKI